MHMWDTILEGSDTLSWQRGRHSLKFGGSYRWFIWPMWALVQSRGYYPFTSGFTTQTATNDGTGAALASFLLGLPASRQVQAGVPTMDLRQWQASAFVQDTWRVSRRTTIDVGLRYEFMAPLADVSGSGATSTRQTASWLHSSAARTGCRGAYCTRTSFALRPASGSPITSSRLASCSTGRMGSSIRRSI